MCFVGLFVDGFVIVYFIKLFGFVINLLLVVDFVFLNIVVFSILDEEVIML